MTFDLVAAPTGRRVGLSVSRQDRRQVLFTVAPKAWRQPGPRHLLYAQSEWPAHVAFSLYEGEHLHTTSNDPGVSPLMWAALGASRQLTVGGPTWDSSLLVPDVPTPRGVSVEQLPARDLEVDTANVLRLFQRVELLPVSSDDAMGARQRSPLHRPLLYRRLLNEVQTQIATARPGYREVIESRTSIRGRTAPSSVARFQAGAAARLTCSYSELSMSTTLLMCVCSALEWIADGRGRRSLLPAEYADVRLRHDAVSLRRVLGDVAAIAARDAVVAGRRLKLGRLDQSWAEALSLSLLVLREAEITASAQTTARVDSVELSVPTDKLWERIVTEALKRSGFESVLPQARELSVDPWIAPRVKAFSHTSPDNVALTHDAVFVVDAKYKAPLEGASPGRDDQYQMFAYSHLVRALPRAVRAAVLVYPGNTQRSVWLRGRDEQITPVELYAVHIPFPSPQEVALPQSWSRYLDAVGQRLATELNVVQRAMSRRSA